jgi:hypothetical protein
MGPLVSATSLQVDVTPFQQCERRIASAREDVGAD